MLGQLVPPLGKRQKARCKWNLVWWQVDHTEQFPVVLDEIYQREDAFSAPGLWSLWAHLSSELLSNIPQKTPVTWGKCWRSQ